MAKQTINLGTSELTGDGESIRSAFGKVNDNFDEVYSDIATLDGSKIVYGDLSVTTASASGAGSLSYNSSTGVFTFTPAASVTETNDLSSAVTWTNIPDAYVPQSAVTQHQAALTITQSQISDLSHFSGDYNDLSNKPTIPTTVSSFTNDAGYITGYTVTESDVTAHQAALSITESQISDLGSYLTTEQHGNFTLSGNSITTSNGDDGIDLVINGANSDPTPAFIMRKWRFADTGAIQFLDPFLSSVDAEITTTKVSNWDTAYGWGNHASAGYLSAISVTTDSANYEANLVFVPSAGNKSSVRIDSDSKITYNPSTNTLTLNSATITSTKIGQWDTAHGWGDHSAAGYITGYTVTESDVTSHQAALSITESQISDLGTYVESDTTGITGADAVSNIVSLTQAEYDAIVTPNASTVYIIVG